MIYREAFIGRDAIVRELKGDEITEHNIISSALNIEDKPGEAA